MIIKFWNSYDRKVFKVNPSIKDFYKEIKHIFSEKEIKQIEEIAKMFEEEMAVEFSHNLKNGWENKLLLNGKVFAKNGVKLNSRKEIQKALINDGKIYFHSFEKNGSCNFIKKIRKSDLCWN